VCEKLKEASAKCKNSYLLGDNIKWIFLYESYINLTYNKENPKPFCRNGSADTT